MHANVVYMENAFKCVRLSLGVRLPHKCLPVLYICLPISSNLGYCVGLLLFDVSSSLQSGMVCKHGGSLVRPWGTPEYQFHTCLSQLGLVTSVFWQLLTSNSMCLPLYTLCLRQLLSDSFFVHSGLACPPSLFSSDSLHLSPSRCLRLVTPVNWQLLSSHRFPLLADPK